MVIPRRLTARFPLGTETDASVEAVLTPAEPGKPSTCCCWGPDSRERVGTSSRADESGTAMRST